MKVVAFYYPSQRAKRIVKWVVIGGVVVGMLLWANSVMAASPLSKDFGKWLGEQEKNARLKGKAIKGGREGEWWEQQIRRPLYEKVRELWAYHKDNSSLTAEQRHWFLQWIDKVMGEVTAKTYHDDWHRGFAKLKGGLVSQKIRADDYYLMRQFLEDPANFDRTLIYETPGTTLDRTIKPAPTSFWKNVFRLSPDTASKEPLMQLPSADTTPAQLPPINQGFQYLHSIPDTTVRLDAGLTEGLSPELGQVANIIIIGGIIARIAAAALGVPLP